MEGVKLAHDDKDSCIRRPLAKTPLEPLNIERLKPRPLDIEIEILYCGICHSDVHKVNDDWASTHFPVVPGHEIAGRVASRGNSATRFQEGDLVGVGCIIDSCLACPGCRAGHEMFCEKGVTFTFDSLDQNTETWTYGGYSTNIVVDERYVLRIPKGTQSCQSRSTNVLASRRTRPCDNSDVSRETMSLSLAWAVWAT